MTKATIVAALRRLGELAAAEDATIELALYGGAVFTVVYGSRESTKDVDAIAKPAALARQLAARIATEMGLAEDWLNDHVRQFLAEREDTRSLGAEDFGPGLIVSVPTAAYLLALKLNAFRSPLPGYSGDHEDIRFLLGKMNLNSIEAIESVYERYFPHDALDDARKSTLHSMIREIHG